MLRRLSSLVEMAVFFSPVTTLPGIRLKVNTAAFSPLSRFSRIISRSSF